MYEYCYEVTNHSAVTFRSDESDSTHGVRKKTHHVNGHFHHDTLPYHALLHCSGNNLPRILIGNITLFFSWEYIMVYEGVKVGAVSELMHLF